MSAENVSRETMAPRPPSVDWIALGASNRLTVSPDQAARLDALASWLAERALPLGLTNYRTPEDISRHALAPTFALFSLAGPALRGPLLDLGAGSGALGLTVAVLCPDLPVTLADRRSRAATFMSLTRARLHLDNVEVRQVSAQELAKDAAGAFQVVCFRALGHAETALRWAAPLLAPGGCVAAWHQAADSGFLHPSTGWLRRATVTTVWPGLSVSLLENVSRETFHRA